MFDTEMPADPSAARDRRFSRQNPLFSSVVRLVPCSGVQFLDLTISTRSLAGTSSKYVRDDDPELGTMLIELPETTRGDGFDLHPVTNRPLAPDDALWLTGYQGLEPFIGTWIPIPYLRFLGRKEATQGRFDKGPSNWARLYIEPPEHGLRNVDTLKAVLAFDTEVDTRSRVEQDQYLAPNTDDVFFGPVFMLVSQPADLGGFLGEPWLDDWVGAAFTDFRNRTAAPRGDAAPPPRFELEHIARYLTLLKVLDANAELPEVRFVNTTAGHWQGRTHGVDLVIDIDEIETAAMIVERRATAAAARKPGFETLRLRDLSQPTVVHEGPFRTVAEFETPAFGDAIASRRSGRADAFYWPSLVRIGNEGQRLALRSSATPGITGLGGLMRGLGESTASTGVWRFSRADSDAGEPGAMVSGELLAHIAEDGSVIGADDGERTPAIRPRFSRSSMLSMFVAECLLHTLSQINAPAALAASGEIREVHRIVVTCPLSASPDERQQLAERIEDAVALVWTARGWSRDGSALAPERPRISLGLDAGLSAQLVYLYDEIKLRFGGDARQFMGLTRGPSRASPARNRDTADCIRIASLDMAGSATSFAMIGYGPDADGGIQPEPLIADRTPIAGASIADAILRAEILPAVAHALAVAGCRGADELVARIVAAEAGTVSPGDPHFASRVLAKILLPAASAFLDIYQGLPAGALSAGAGQLVLGDLVRQGRGRLAPLDAQIEAMAAVQGARGFRLAEVGVKLRPRAVARTLERQLDPLLARVAEVVSDYGADLLLLSGRHARLPDVGRLLLKHLPLGPHRIIDVCERWSAVAGELAGDADAGRDIRLLPLVGAAFGSSRGGFAGDRFGMLAERLSHVAANHGAGLPGVAGETAAALRLARLGHNAPARIGKSAASADALATLIVRGDAGGAQ
jgi:hypothetical protein